MNKRAAASICCDGSRDLEPQSEAQPWTTRTTAQLQSASLELQPERVLDVPAKPPRDREGTGVPTGGRVSLALPPSLRRRCEAVGDQDARALALAASRPGVGRLLRHSPRITPTLIRQLDLVPAVLRHPTVFAILADLEISAARWKRIAVDLAAIDDPRRATLGRRARTISDRGAFWDLVEDIRVAARHGQWRAPDLGADFVHLGSAVAMRQEASVMRNCLGDMVPEAAGGQSAFFRWLGSERVTVHLRPVGANWRLAALGGPRNTPLSPATSTAIEDLLRRTLGEAALDAPSFEDAVLAIAETGRARFDAGTRGTIASVLWDVHQRARKTENACIFGAGGRYVQFCVNRSGWTLRAEVAAHKFCPESASWLTEGAVDLLDRCSFRWPRVRQNFAREFAVRTRRDCGELADFECGLHQELWSHQVGEPLSIGVIGEEASASEGGCRLGSCHWFSA